MALHGKPPGTAKTPARPARTRRARPLAATTTAAATALALGTGAAASASTTPALTYGTLDSQPAHAAAEAHAGVTNAMLELNWSSFEPAPGAVSPSYLATMKSYLASFAAAGQHVTLALGLHTPRHPPRPRQRTQRRRGHPAITNPGCDYV